MAAITQTTDARTAVKTLEVDDVVRIPQYEGALKVTFVGDGNEFIGVEFVDEKKAARGASKSLIVNKHSGNVYLIAGTSDKGRVETIETVTKGHDEESAEGEEGDDTPAVTEEPVDVGAEDVEVTKVTVTDTRKVVYEFVGHFSVNGDRREKTAAVHHNGEEWVLNGHRGFGPGTVRLASGDSREEIIFLATQNMSESA